jgi:membrane fusion protein (multidrug efflux system)
MYATATIGTGTPQRYITLPQTAITFNPFGNMVFVVQDSTDKAGKKILAAKQIVVTTGETRGDQVAVTKGLNEGDVVVSAGQLKLLNDTPVVINNAILPANDPNPHPVER